MVSGSLLPMHRAMSRNTLCASLKYYSSSLQ